MWQLPSAGEDGCPVHVYVCSGIGLDIGRRRSLKLLEHLRVCCERHGWLVAKAYRADQGSLELGRAVGCRSFPPPGAICGCDVDHGIADPRSSTRCWSENIQLGFETEHLWVHSSHETLSRQPPNPHRTKFTPAWTLWCLSHMLADICSVQMKWSFIATSLTVPSSLHMIITSAYIPVPFKSPYDSVEQLSTCLEDYKASQTD